MPFNFIEKDPAELGEHRMRGSKTGRLPNNGTQQITEEDREFTVGLKVAHCRYILTAKYMKYEWARDTTYNITQGERMKNQDRGEE